MELIKDKMAYTNFKKLENHINEMADKNVMEDFNAKSYVDRFIEAFSSDYEQKHIQEYTYQISAMIDKIHDEKNIMLSEIDVAYLMASNLQIFTIERAKHYMKALDRIEEYYLDKKIHTYLMRFKNL